MIKGLITALVAGALSLSATSFGAAPVIFNIPDVTVGDLDSPNCVGTGANFFVFTGAFNLDDSVSDADTPVANLLWSFSEADDIADQDSINPQQWYQVNGKDPILVGSAAIVADDLAGNPAALAPGANELRSVDPNISIRDIVLSPLSGPPFNPTAAQLAEHAAGKVMRFYVSDGTNVATKEILINSVDNVCDSASGGSALGNVSIDTFDTAPTGWQTLIATPANTDPSFGSIVARNYDAVNKAITVRLNADTGSIGLSRTGSWTTTDAYSLSTMPYSSVGANNFVRSKWYVYGTKLGSASTLPATRMQLHINFVQASTLEVFSGNGAGTVGVRGDELGPEIQPSLDPNNPSMYRSDFNPIDVPALAGTGITRHFIVDASKLSDAGTIGLTESVIGTIPNTAVSWTPITTLAPSGSDAGGLKITGNDAPGFASLTRFSYLQNVLDGRPGTYDYNAGPTKAEGTFGVTLDSTAFNNEPNATFVGGSKVGIAIASFSPGAILTNRPRVEAGKQYQIRYHLSSNISTAVQPQIRLQVATGDNTYAQKFEMGGALAGGAPSRAISQQTMPGIGTQNPQKNGVETNGGYYDLMIATPLSSAIRPDVVGTLEQRMPTWFIFAGQGVTDPVGGYTNQTGELATVPALNGRDLRPSVGLLDSLTFTGDAQPLGEAGRFSVDSIVTSSSPLVEDGSPQ